jgi:hypothetical protein
VLFHFLLLDRVADQNRIRRKPPFAGRVLGMEVRGGEEELLIS